MIILGIHGNFINKEELLVNESSASVVINGQLISCIAEERISRIKIDGKFPWLAIAEVLRLADISINDVNQVAITSLHPAKTNKEYLKAALSTYLDTGVFLSAKIKNSFYYYIYNSLRTPKKSIDTILGKQFQLLYTDHHMAHAASAYYCSPFDKALIITLDGGGDGLDGSASIGMGNKIARLFKVPHYQSPGTMYSALTHDLGFKRHKHEGKVTGLAAFGNANITRLGLDDLLKYDKNKHRFISKSIALHHKSLLSKSEYFYPLLGEFPKEDLAAVCQQIFENEILKFIEDGYNMAKSKGHTINKICLAGGCFANVKLNQRILEMGNFNNLFVFPAMGDDGLSAGAALLNYYKLLPNEQKNKSIIKDAYLGGSFTDEQIEIALKASGLIYTYKDEISKEVATLLANGNVVARFNSRMEYGPRALGNRSVLASPFDKSINNWLNNKFKRTEFMPFAPSILEEYADTYLENYSTSHFASDYMTITYSIKSGLAEKIPAVVHVDNTARPQIVRNLINPSYHSIINHFFNITGIPVILNTSFNMHEEPIVYSPDDAIRAFKDAGLDYLAIGNYLAKIKQNE